MQGSPAILDALNALLADELAARDQYFAHSRRLEDLGLQRIAARLAHEVDDETSHADALVQRILMLGGEPRMVPSAINVARDIPAIFENDLAVEVRVIDNLRAAMALAETERDYVTRNILLPMLKDTEEDHAHWLEQQLRLIGLVGLQNYLQRQMS